MAINDTDKLLVNDGSKTETITFAQFKDKAVLNDTDKFLINDGTKTETITWAEIEDSLGPKGIVNTPTVLKPDDGAGSGDLTYLITDPITDIEDLGGGQTKLTVSGDTDLAGMTGAVFMSDGTPTDGPYSQTGYKLVTTDIEGVADYNGNVWTDSPLPVNGDFENIIDGDLNTRVMTGAANSSNYEYGIFVDIKGLLGDYSGPLYNVNNVSGGVGQYYGYVIFEDNTESPKVDIYAGSGALAFIPYYTPNGKKVKTLVTTAKSGRTPGSITKGISTTQDTSTMITGTYSGSGKTLTFSGNVNQNPDLQYFRQGDVIQAGQLQGFNPAGKSCYYILHTIDVPTGGTMEFVLPDSSNGSGAGPGAAIDGNLSTRCIQPDPRDQKGIDMYFPDGIGSSTTGISVYLTSSADQYIALNGDFDNPILLPGDSKVDLTDYAPIQRDGKLYRFTYWNTTNTYYTGVNSFCNSRNGTDNPINLGGSSGYGTSTGFSPDITVLSNGYDLDPKENKLVVSGGNWGFDETNDWLQYVTPSSGIYQTNRGPDKAFDGLVYQDSGGWNNACMPIDGTVTFRFPERLAFNGRFRLNFTKNLSSITWADSAPNILINGIDIKPWLEANHPNAGAADKYPSDWIDFSNELTSGLNLGTTLSEIVFGGTSGEYNTRLYAIEVDGRVLLQGAASEARDERVEYQTNGGEGTIVSVNSTDKTITLNDTGNRDNRWIKGATDADGNAGNSGESGDAANAEDFYVAGPDEVDSPLLTANVWLESSAFSTTPATNSDGGPLDALEKITWSITPEGSAEMIQDAGTSNPYQPTGLALNTWHTIKVKHEGLLLGESVGPWSTSTRFKTGLSRSLKEHYMKQIEELQKQIGTAD